MNDILINIILLLIAYLFGSFPSALLVGKIFRNVDLRKEGSCNLGTTNAIRILGKPLGFFVFFLDLLKAIIVMLIVKFNDNLFQFDNLWHPIFFGLSSVIGHIYPIFTKFKGGKAVACSLAICACLAPIPAFCCLIAFYITLKISGYVSLSSLNAALTVLITITLQMFVFNFEKDILVYSVVCFLVAIIFYKHRKNLVRIFKGTENNFKKKKLAQKKESELTDSSK